MTSSDFSDKAQQIRESMAQVPPNELYPLLKEHGLPNTIGHGDVARFIREEARASPATGTVPGSGTNR